MVGWSTKRVSLEFVKALEAQYENGLLRPCGKLNLRSGERVKIVVLRRPDRGRWDFARLSQTSDDEAALTKQDLSNWAAALDSEDHS